MLLPQGNLINITNSRCVQRI